MYVIDAYSKNPIFQINKHIGFDKDVIEDGELIEGDGYGIMGTDFSKEFFETDRSNPDLITIYTNCMGGDVFQSYEIFNCILAAQSETESIINGFAYSTGGWIPLAAKKVKMVDYGSWMGHFPYNPNNPEEKSEFLDMVLNSVCIVLSERSGRNGKPKKTTEDIKNLLEVKTYFTAQQMYDEGLIDEIIPSSIKISEDSAKNMFKQTQVAFNKFIENKYKKTNTMAFEKVLNRLKLASDSDEASVLAKIAFIENEQAMNMEKLTAVNSEVIELRSKLKASNDSKEEIAAKLKEAENAKNEATDAYNKMFAKMEEMDAENKKSKEELKTIAEEKLAAENKFKLERAENLIKEYRETGKIKSDEAAANYTKRAVVNYEDTKFDLEQMNASFKAPTPFSKTGGTAINRENEKSVFNRYKKESASNYALTQKEKEEARRLALTK